MASTHWFLERNPLLEKLPTFDDLGRLADAIRFHPLAGLDMNALTVMQRISLLVMEKFPFEPTEQSISAAITMIGMLFGSLQARNPLRAETRRELWTYLDAAASGATTLPISTIATFSAYALKGITGTGKSVLVHMVRQLFPEKIVHSPCAEAGWTQMVHLVHLYVKLSHDGTRGGFLTGILLEMDRVLGTDYAVTLRRRHRTVEGLSVATVAQLHAHYLGILFVDEGQMRNLIESGQAELMQMFLLMILNSGIPVVFMGNPLAYEWLATFSQDLRRLHEKPPAFLHPIGAVPGGDEDADGDAIFLGVSRYYVLRKPFSDPKGCKQQLKKCGGGIPGLELILWCNAQMSHLLEGETGELSPADIVAAYRDEGFDKLRDLADGFADKDPLRLVRFVDVPYHYYAKVWGKPIGAAVTNPDAANSARGSKSTKKNDKGATRSTLSEKAKLRSQQTRERKRVEAREALQASLEPGDMRMDGVRQVQLDGLAAVRAEIDKKSTQP